jgi:hypothetical protein
MPATNLPTSTARAHGDLVAAHYAPIGMERFLCRHLHQ